MALPTQEDLDARANAEAQAKIDAAKAEVARQQDEAARRRAAAQASLQAAGQAGAGMLQEIGPRVGAAYNDAAREIGGVSGAFSEEMRARIAAAQAANQGFVGSQTGMTGPSTLDPTKAKDTMHYLGGYIPAADLATQGAAARTRAEGMPAVLLAGVQQGIHDLLNKGSEEDRTFAEELIKIAQEFPELKAQAYERLFDEAMKRAEFEHGVKMDEQNAARQDRAQDLYEEQFAQKKKEYKFDVWLQGQKLKIQRADQQAAVAKAIREGKQPNASLSEKYGYIVDSDGNAILGPDGKKISVAKAPKAKSPPAPGESGYQKAVKEARTLRGTPVAVSDDQTAYGAKGRYIARPGAKGTFPPVKDKNGTVLVPRTTNNPNLAQRDGEMNFAQAQAYLTDVYGLKPQQARRALIAAGWRPDGRRP